MGKVNRSKSDVEKVFGIMLKHKIEVRESRGKILAYFQTPSGESDYVQVMLVDFGNDAVMAAVAAILMSEKKIETGEAF